MVIILIICGKIDGCDAYQRVLRKLGGVLEHDKQRKLHGELGHEMSK